MAALGAVLGTPLVAACGGVAYGEPEATGNAGANGNASGGSGDPGASTGGAAGGSGSSSSGSGGTTGGGSGSGKKNDGGGAVSTCNAVNTPSVQGVDFVVTNGGAATRYLVTSGNMCDEFAISGGAGGPALDLRPGFQCLCECPNPGSARAATLRRLAPGEKATLHWDARVMTPCNESVSCASLGWPGMGTAQKMVPSFVPIMSKTLEAKVVALDAVPSECVSGDGGATFSCFGGLSGGYNPGTFPGPIQRVCPGDRHATATFTLGAAKTTTVPLTLN